MDFVTKVLIVLFGYVTLFYGVRGFHNDPKCGQNPYRTPKIIGGENVREAEFPWFVSIKETGRYECGGFIISKKAVLTAAHCFRHFSDRAADSPKTISVTLAVHYLNHKKSKPLNKFSKWELDVKVKRIIRHPRYNASSNSGKFDIALLQLDEEIQWNLGTRPVCLPTIGGALFPGSSNTVDAENGSSSPVDFETGEIAIVAGWPIDSDKVKSAEARESANVLQKVRLTLYGNEECNQVLKEKNVTLEADIDSSMLCAASPETGVDSCRGDSGSAVLVQRGNVWVAIGIVSSGFGPCGSGVPGLYTRISTYLDWIDLHDAS